MLTGGCTMKRINSGSYLKSLEPPIFIGMSISCGREFHWIDRGLPTEYTLISINQVALSMQRA